MKFVAVGDNCIDWYYLQNEFHAGGCSLNVSVYIRQLGGNSAYIGAVGQDKNGEFLKNELQKRKVDISHLHVLKGNTAVTRIRLIDNDRIFCGYDEGVLSQNYIDEEDIQFIRSMDFMHTSAYGNCQEFLKYVKNDVTIIYDFAYMLEKENISSVLPNIHYGFFSYNQDDDFIRDYLKKSWKMGEGTLKLLVVTLGSRGSLSYDGSEFYIHRIDPVEAVDTMGAGDSFIAGFMIGLSCGKNYRECMEIGSRKAKETVLCKGAF